MAYEKFMGLIGEAYSKLGTRATIVQPILSPPSHRSLSEFKFIDLKTAAGLALFAGWIFRCGGAAVPEWGEPVFR